MSDKQLWKPYDTRDDRKEIAYLLEKIPPTLRVRWLRWCCTKCTLPNSAVRPCVPPYSTGENAMECYFDFWSLVNQYRLKPEIGLDALIQVVKAWERGWFTKGSPVRLHLPR